MKIFNWISGIAYVVMAIILLNNILQPAKAKAPAGDAHWDLLLPEGKNEWKQVREFRIHRFRDEDNATTCYMYFEPEYKGAAGGLSCVADR